MVLYRDTPSITVSDNRNLTVRNIQYHRHPDLLAETDERITRWLFDLSGALIQSLSPRQYDLQQTNISVPPNQKIFNSLSRQRLRTDSTDEGTNTVLNDLEGRVVINVTAMNVKRIWQYEEATLLGRPLAVTEKPEGESARTVERFLWAGNSAAEKAKNLVGFNHSHYHFSGVDFIDSVALKGDVLIERRGFLKDEQEADWQSIDNADSVLSEDIFTTSVSVDATGAMLTQTDALGNLQRQAYNIAGQIKNRGLTLSGQTTEQIIIRQRNYSAAGQIVQEIAGNGVVTSYRYEPETQRLIGIKTERPMGHVSGAAILQDLRYAFDPVGNVISVFNDAEATRFWRNQKVVPEKTYVYDSLYQLVSATGREMVAAQQTVSSIATIFSDDKTNFTNYIRCYHYDRDNNLARIQHRSPATGNNYSTELTISSRSNRAVLKTLTNNPDEVEALFDAAGNQLQLLPRQDLSWNDRGELQQVMPVTRDSVSTSDREWYRYDSGGQRVIKTTYQMQGNSQWQIRKISLSGLESVMISQNNSQKEVYERINVGNAEVLHWRLGKPSTIANDSICFNHKDRTGNCMLETDKDGLVTSQEEFYPFGETAIWLARSQVEADYKTYRYSGKERDATGLYYYGFRYYQPWAGRWLSADPAGTIDGLNQYRMVRNNPATFGDRDGLMIDQQTVVEEYFITQIRPAVLRRAEQDKEYALRVIQTKTNSASQTLGEIHEKAIAKLENARLTVNVRPETIGQLNASAGLKNIYSVSHQKTPQYIEERTNVERWLYDVGGNQVEGFEPDWQQSYQENYEFSGQPGGGQARPIYGALSFNEERGAGGAAQYGSSVLYLNNDIKALATFTPYDSHAAYQQLIKSQPTSEGAKKIFTEGVAVTGNLNPLIRRSGKVLFNYLISDATEEPKTYFEWQAHTPIKFNSAIESFRLNSDSFQEEAKAFTSRNNIKWQDEPKKRGLFSRFGR